MYTDIRHVTLYRLPMKSSDKIPIISWELYLREQEQRDGGTDTWTVLLHKQTDTIVS